MDKLAADIFGTMLARFSGLPQPIATYQKVAAMSDTITITVPTIEAEVHPAALIDSDHYYDRTVTLNAALTERAYALLVERHADEFDAIVSDLVNGRKA